MQAIDRDLVEVRPIVRNMRTSGYIMQTAGSATRKIILNEGTSEQPYFRCTGVPRHTHNSSAIMEITVTIKSECSDQEGSGRIPGTRISNAGEFTFEEDVLQEGDPIDVQIPYGLKYRIDRCIEHCTRMVQLQPENCQSFISEPSGAIAEIRTLVTSKQVLDSLTYAYQVHDIVDGRGVGINSAYPDVEVPFTGPRNGLGSYFDRGGAQNLGGENEFDLADTRLEAYMGTYEPIEWGNGTRIENFNQTLLNLWTNKIAPGTVFLRIQGSLDRYTRTFSYNFDKSNPQYVSPKFTTRARGVTFVKISNAGTVFMQTLANCTLEFSEIRLGAYEGFFHTEEGQDYPTNFLFTAHPFKIKFTGFDVPNAALDAMSISDLNWWALHGPRCRWSRGSKIVIPSVFGIESIDNQYNLPIEKLKNLLSPFRDDATIGANFNAQAVNLLHNPDLYPVSKYRGLYDPDLFYYHSEAVIVPFQNMIEVQAQNGASSIAHAGGAVQITVTAMEVTIPDALYAVFATGEAQIYATIQLSVTFTSQAKTVELGFDLFLQLEVANVDQQAHTVTFADGIPDHSLHDIIAAVPGNYTITYHIGDVYVGTVLEPDNCSITNHDVELHTQGVFYGPIDDDVQFVCKITTVGPGVFLCGLGDELALDQAELDALLILLADGATGRLPIKKLLSFIRALDGTDGSDFVDIPLIDIESIMPISNYLLDIYKERSPFYDIVAAASDPAPGGKKRKEIRISQHLAGPVINADRRIGCRTPLDQSSIFIPPELRDFTLRLTCDWSRLGLVDVEVERLIFSEFNGGNQQVALTPSLLSIPEFKLFSTTPDIDTGKFEMSLYTPMGPPAFWCFFARLQDRTKDVDVNDDGYGPGHPLISNMSIMCETTGKKSDTIDNASAAEMYFATHRNTHNDANYTHVHYNARQTILLTSEDVGTMGLSPLNYQREKRARYIVSGTCDNKSRPTTMNAVLVYTNRGLQIVGKQFQMVYINE